MEELSRYLPPREHNYPNVAAQKTVFVTTRWYIKKYPRFKTAGIKRVTKEVNNKCHCDEGKKRNHLSSWTRWIACAADTHTSCDTTDVECVKGSKSALKGTINKLSIFFVSPKTICKQHSVVETRISRRILCLTAKTTLRLFMWGEQMFLFSFIGGCSALK